jgi:hypothetical protein
VGKPEGRRPLGRPRRKWQGNIRRDLREIGLDSPGSVWEPVEGSCEHGNEYLGSVKCWEILQ